MRHFVAFGTYLYLNIINKNLEIKVKNNGNNKITKRNRKNEGSM